MRVSELAKELNTSSEMILSKLKALKLKAKDSSQELNNAVAVVIRSALDKELKTADKSRPTATPGKKTDSPKTKKAVEEPAPAKSEKPAKQPEKKKTVSSANPAKAAKFSAADSGAVVSKIKAAFHKPAAIKEKPAVDKKNKAKIIDAPFETLKPLSKKRRRTPGPRGIPEGREGHSEDSGVASTAFAPAGASAQTTSSVSASMPSAPEQLMDLEINLPIAVKDFAVVVQQKTSVILKRLMQLGIFANINQYLDESIVKKLAEELGYNISKVKTPEQQLIAGHQQEEDDPELLKPRAPVVTFMGHVDHGKTSLLDRIRKSRVADQEHGGITQHIGAYSVKVPKGKITFLDTPGHEAFTAMRARGAHITDLVVLVVAADEGIMPQTEEAVNHAHAAGVPIVVALNKIDKRDADPDRVKKQLADYGLNPEDWGGKTVVVGVSATTGQGIDQLLEMILLESEMLELKSNANKRASGIVVEAHMSQGKGTVASLIVQSGTLHFNDVIVIGPHYGKAKAMFDDLERPITEAGPSTPVEILGLDGVPEAGEKFYVVEDERAAKNITSARLEQIKIERMKSNLKITLEDLYSQIKEGAIKELNVILKADVKGSLEALRDSLAKIPSEEVKVKFIHTGVGEINSSDVILAHASNAIIIAFHVGVDARARTELEKMPVDVRQYRIIYDAVNDLKKALEGLLEPKTRRKFQSRIEVRQVFKLSKSGIVAGCFVVKGKVTRKAHADVIRNGEVVHSGVLSSLKRFKDDVRDVGEGFECGLTVQGFDKIEAGDIVETYELETIARTL